MVLGIVEASYEGQSKYKDLVITLLPMLELPDPVGTLLTISEWNTDLQPENYREYSNIMLKLGLES